MNVSIKQSKEYVDIMFSADSEWHFTQNFTLFKPCLKYKFWSTILYPFGWFIETVGAPVFFSVFFNVRQTQDALHEFADFWKRRKINPTHFLQPFKRIAQNEIRPS